MGDVGMNDLKTAWRSGVAAKAVILILAMCVVAAGYQAVRMATTAGVPVASGPTPVPDAAALSSSARNAEYPAVDGRDLVTYPNKYLRQRLHVSGRVIKVNASENAVQVMIADGQAILAFSSVPLSSIYEDDQVYVYGVAQSPVCGKNAFGGEVCQVRILRAYVEK